MDFDYDQQLDIMSEVEQTFDYDISMGRMSNYEAGMLRQLFFDVDAEDGLDDYLVSFQQLYEYIAFLMENGEWS